MSTPLTLVVVIAAGDARDATTASMKHAAEETLGTSATVVLRETPHPLGDDEAVALERSLHADAIAEVAWRDPDRRRAQVHLHVQSSSRWIDREIGFASSDAPSEQGRTIGFTVASMLPERAPDPAPTPLPPPPPPLDARAPTTALPAGGSEQASPPPPSVPRHWGGAVDAVALGASSLDSGYGGGIGAAFGGEWYVASHFALRAGFSARYAAVDPAHATSLVLTGGLGLAWRSWTPTLTRRFAFGARVDGLALREGMSHQSADDPSAVHESRWLPGADAILEGSWLFTDGASVVAGGGAEVAFGKTDVVVHGAEAASIPPLHALLFAGIRARF